MYHHFFTHWLSGRMFNLRPRSPWFEPYCLFVCLLVCLFIFVHRGSDITSCIKFNIHVTPVVYQFWLRFVMTSLMVLHMATSKLSSTQYLSVHTRTRAHARAHARTHALVKVFRGPKTCQMRSRQIKRAYCTKITPFFIELHACFSTSLSLNETQCAAFL